jgi:MOB kinase activator 1
LNVLISGAPFPPNFKEKYVKVIFRRLFRVYAHIYHSHLKESEYFLKQQASTSLILTHIVSNQTVVQLGEEAHLNTSFKHFIMFVQEFELIEKKELAPLQELIDVLLAKDTGHKKD